VSESWSTPDTIHDRSREARARSEALHLVCERPEIRALIDERELPLSGVPGQFATDGADAPPWASANLARATDALASERLRLALSLPDPVRRYIKDWSASLAHEDVDRWAASAHEAINQASGPPIPTSPGKRIGQVERWVGWWYRSQILHDEISKIAREEIGATGVTNNRAYVRTRIDEVVELLSDQNGPHLPLRVARGNLSRVARRIEHAKRILENRGEG